jgi:LMBR1 domain-containing protein 1
MSIILLAINIYLLILYIHPDDKGWGNAVYCKILVVLGLTLCQAQALMVPLDVANRSAVVTTGMDMKVFWYLLYIVVLGFITILIPYAIFLYETDEEDSMCSRLLKAFCYLFASLIISVLILFITWIFFKYVDIPYEEVAISVSQTGTTNITSPTVSDLTLTMETSLAVYVIAILSFFGWILLVIFGGVSLFALPIDMINEFRHRPKARKTADMKKTKDKMALAITNLMK